MAKPQKDGLPSLSATELIHEMADVDLGDERLNKRLLALMGRVASSPSSSFSSMCESDAELEGLYRFVRNPRVEWRDILEPHREQTFERMSEANQAIVVHDTTTVRVSDEADFESYISTGKKGFLAHVALAFDRRNAGMPLGVTSMEVLCRGKRQTKTKKNGRKMSGAETAKLKNKEYGRWWRAIEETENTMEGTEAIHVMDREGDSFDLLSKLHGAEYSYVIRWSKDRNAKKADDDSGTWKKVSELLGEARSTKFKREVYVGKRKAKTAPAAAKATPQRDSRMASLRFARITLTLKKPCYLPKSAYPDSLNVNLVHVYEPAPPPGEKPIEWVLLTNLPIKTARDVESVVDIYRQRWPIEEFFKAIKSGCAYRKRNLTNPQSILNTLATFIPVAYRALLLRQLARVAVFPAKRALSPTELKVLKAKAKKIRKPLGRNPTAQDALEVIARIGGHRKSSGPPGWATIMKGMETFLTLVEGWQLANA